jgi:Asp-tRNA(Asn)/Glu-tRNA(Gln) amidotransferase A subunit family amidase
MPLCWSLDKIGPLARTVEDAMWTLAATSGVDRRDPSAIAAPLRYDARTSVRGIRVGRLAGGISEGHAGALERAALETLQADGATLVDVTLPTMPYDALLTILFAEAAAAFESLTLEDRDDALRWQGAAAWPNTFRAARFITAIDLVAADRLRRRAMQAMAAVLDDVDAIVGASFTDPMLLLTNMTGHPCAVVPIGFVERAPEPGTDGRAPASASPFAAPHGITVWGRLFDEGTVAAIARSIERPHGRGVVRPAAGARVVSTS